MKRKSVRWSGVVVSGLTVVGVAGGARGQESLAGVETEMTPEDLPGSGPGPRTREAAKAPAAPEVKVDSGTPEAPKAREWFGGLAWWDWSRATGDWGGVRTALEDGGLTINASLTHDWSSVWSGGLNQRASSRRLFNLNAELDLGTLAGWEGGTVYAEFYHYGGRLVNDAGDIMVYDNIAVDRHRDQLAELWFQQVFGEGLVRLKVGKIEANKEFAFLDASSNGLHSSGGYSPNVLGFPTYPDPALGVTAFVYPLEWLYAGFGFFDGATLDGIRTGSRAGFDTFFGDSKSDDNFFIGEVGATWGSLGEAFARSGRGRVAGGVWHHTHEFERFSGGIEDGSTGGYVLGEQLLIKRDEDPESDLGLWLFARGGFADDEVAAVETHATAGLTLRGTFEGRDDDVFGVMYNFADLSDKNAAFDGDEHALEVYYRIRVTGSVFVTPDFQYIANPSGDAALDDAVVGTLRVQVSF